MSIPVYQPFTPELWLPKSPAEELDEIYTKTLESRFKSFSVVPYETVKSSYTEPYPLTPYDPVKSIPDWLLESIVTRDSFEKLQETLGNFIVDRGLDDWIDHNGALAIVTDHGQFTDVPITAEAVGRIGMTERSRTLQVISRMISKMSLDFGDDSLIIVQDELTGISSLVSTIPRIDGNPSQTLIMFRELHNAIATHIIDNALTEPGTVLVESFIGRHNSTSKSGKTLYIHEPNRKTAELLAKPEVIVLPVYVHCPTFHSDGSFGPADLAFKIFEPEQIINPTKATHHIAGLFKEATQETVGHLYKYGVKVRSWKNQNQRDKSRNRFRRIIGVDTTLSEY